MTVQATEPLYSDVYVSSGVELDFPFPFSAFRDSDVGVAIRAPGAESWTPLDYGADYTVSRNPAPVIGGTVFLPAPLAAGWHLIAYANIEFSQDRKFENQSGLFLFEIEASLDKLTAMAKLLADDAERAPRTDRFTGGRGLIMPEPEPGRALIGRADGEGWTSGPTGPEIANAETYANEAKAARDKARQWADDPENSPVEPGLFSARHHAAKARADAIQTAADRVQTGLDKVATGADRVQTGLDAQATAADRFQTGLDAVATGADRVQTGLDRAASEPAAVTATTQAGIATTQAGIATTKATEAAASAALANGMPLGTIMHFAADTPPSGWLVCDGTAVTGLYPDLRAFLLDAGSPYGTSGADPLLPDLRGEFVRGWDGGRGVDAGRVFGSAQGDAIRNIVGALMLKGDENDGTGAFARVAALTGRNSQGISGLGREISFDASRVVPTADDNRPRNIALLPCIRAYASAVNVPGQADLDNILQQTQVQVDDALDRVVGDAETAAMDKVAWKRVGKVPVGTGAAVTLTGLDLTKETLIVLGYVRCSVTSAQTLRIRHSEDGGSNWGASPVVASSTSNWSASYLWGDVRMFPDPDNSEVVTSILTGPTTAAAYTYVTPPLYAGAIHQAINALQFSWSSGNFQATGLGGNADHIIIYQRG